ncbi:MAG: COG1470 family protein, partial [Flavipsychrobacter sp.]
MQRGLFLMGIMLLIQIAAGAQEKAKQPAADTIVSKIQPADTTVKSAVVPSVSKDTATQKIITAVTDSLAKADTTNVHKRKGTKRRKISDEDMDVLTQKIVQTSDQKQDVTNITIVPKPVNAPVSNKAPNTEAAPAASTAVINTLDPSPSFATNKENNNTVKNGTDNVQIKSGVQNQMNAQLNSLYTTSLLRDSLMANSNKDFLFNNVTITNTSSAKITLLVTINIPNTWQLITDKVTTITLEPNASQVIPMRLLPTNSSSAGWEQVTLDYRNTETGDTRHDFYNVRVQEFAKFKARLMNPTLVLLAYQKLISIPIYIRNSGNVTGNYTIASVNEFLHLDDKMNINLDGGRDTIYNLSLAISENEYKMLTKQDIRIVVSSKDDAYNLVQSISKVGYILKDHPSAYMDMPVQVEAGMVSQGGNANQYYGGVYGSVDVDKDNRVAVAFRSNTISRDQNIDNGLMRMDYTGKHVIASVGNIMEMTDFMMDGYGAKVGYNWGVNNGNKGVIYGMLKSRVGNSQVFGGNGQFKLNDIMRLTESVSANIDKVTKLNSSIARQTLDMKMLNDQLKLSLIAGVGMEQNTATMLPGQSNQLLGSSFGYNLQYLSKHFSTISNILYNSNSFAGIYKGQRLQSHDARFILNKFFVGGYYEYNYKSQNTFDDSVLLNNVFAIKSQNYGGRIGYSTKFANMILSVGDQQQLQSGDGNNFTSDYKYTNLNATFSITKKIYLNVNSYNGMMSTDNNKVNNLYVSSTTGTLTAYYGGLAFRYDHGP